MNFPAAFFQAALSLTFALLAAAFLLSLLRVVRGPSIPDRVVALDLMAMVAVGVMAASAVSSDESSLLDAAMIIALIAFVGTVAFARYLEKGGR